MNNNTTIFPDVPNDKWYSEYVKIANEAGIMVGYEDGTFRPDEPLKRCEAASIVAQLLKKFENA